MIFVSSQYCNQEDSYNDIICVDRNNVTLNYIKKTKMYDEKLC